MKVSISNIPFKEKPAPEDSGKVNNSLVASEVSIQELAGSIANGCSFCPAIFTNNVRNNENFISASCITLDVDHAQYSLEYATECISTTIAYPSFRNGLDGEYRYRLLIRLEEDIKSLEEYYRYSIILAAMLKEKANIVIDSTCTQGTRMYFGTNSSVTLLDEKEYDYTKAELDEWWTTTYGNKPIVYGITSCTAHNVNNVDRASIVYKLLKEGKEDEEILNVCFSKGYKPIDSSFINWEPEEETKIVPDFIKIDRQWQINTTGKRTPRIWRIGENRKYRLLKTLTIKKQIKPDIRYDELLFNAIYERYYFFDNSDGKLSNKWLLSILPPILNHNNNIHFQTAAKLKCNTEYLKQIGKSYQKASAEAKHKMLVDAVLPLYNKDFTIKENLEAMQNKGLKLSLRTLKTILKEAGISKSRKKIVYQAF